MVRSLLLTVLTLNLLAACSIGEVEQVDNSLRLLNHWDNLDGTVERGYAGHSIFWHHGGVDTLCIQEYGQRNASVGINGTVINNVNASPLMLTQAYLDTTATYANLLRPYGIRTYISVNFATPMALGETSTADPLDSCVIAWWERKAAQIYKAIPDFGGFLVKANSEGQPGPCDFGRTHAEGANMLAKALRKGAKKSTFANVEPNVIWRSFVYSPSDPDRAKQAYIEFASLDGQFEDNVIIQIKNGPVDFQPREPVSPLFYAMPHTRLMAELQITQEYLGHSNHTAFLAPMWTEFLSEAQCAGLTIKDFAGVSNIGYKVPEDGETHHGVAWCGNKLAEANWYAFGRLAECPTLTSEEIAEEWISREFSSLSDQSHHNLASLLLMSREAVVDYMMPLGLHHIFAWGHHYGPEPWCAIPGARPDWMPSYYHCADNEGLGFDRTVLTGSGATAQYCDSLAALYEDIDTCPEKYLLWFHHVSWDYQRTWECCGETETLWQHLGRHYQRGVDQAFQMHSLWLPSVEDIDDGVVADMEQRLCCQQDDAIWWRDACLLYFQQFSAQPWPTTAGEPIHTLDDLKKVRLGITNYECPSISLLNSLR